MLGKLFSLVGGNIVESLLGKVEGVFKAYFEKQISLEELKVRLGEALLQSFVEVEKAHADALTKTYASFMDAAKQSLLMQAVWAAVALSQLAVLLWHQVGISALCYFVGNKACWPSSGSTVEWAYLLLGGCIGLGPIMLRAGPAGNVGDKLKSLVSR